MLAIRINAKSQRSERMIEMAQHYTVTTLMDATQEKSAFKLYNGAITAASLPGFLTNYASLKAAIDGMTVGTLSDDQWVGDKTHLSDVIPGNLAQREIKLLIGYHGVTANKNYSVTLPTLDLTKVIFTPGGGDAVSLTQPAEMVALIDAIELIGRSPDNDAENIVVDYARVVGRNI